jgi:hypothetical protein
MRSSTCKFCNAKIGWFADGSRRIPATWKDSYYDIHSTFENTAAVPQGAEIHRGRLCEKDKKQQSDWENVFNASPTSSSPSWLDKELRELIFEWHPDRNPNGLDANAITASLIALRDRLRVARE